VVVVVENIQISGVAFFFKTEKKKILLEF